MLEKLKYPIGECNITLENSSVNIDDWIKIIENHPNNLTLLVSNLSKDQLDTTYRPDGWTIRQVIHHLGDSHTNSYIRLNGH